MGVDEAGQHDHVSRIDDRDAGGSDRFADGDDHAITNVDIAGLQISPRAVHGQHMAAADDVFAEIGWCRRRWSWALRTRCSGCQRAGGQSRLHEVAAPKIADLAHEPLPKSAL